MENIIKNICNYVSIIYLYFKNLYKSEKEQAKQQQLLIQAKQKQQYMYNIMSGLAKELYSVLNRRRYYFIQTILSPNDIRIVGCQMAENKVYYIFELSKSTSNSVQTAVLLKVKENINSDIAQLCHHLLSTYGEYSFSISYPFLYYGIMVVGIQDIGLGIQIKVLSNYQ